MEQDEGVVVRDLACGVIGPVYVGADLQHQLNIINKQ